MPFPGMAFGGRRGRKARRGDVRSAILSLLSDASLNGYQIMGAISERSQGAWRPSPGAVYPALQQLTDEGLIEPTGEGRRTLYQLTDAGRAYVTENAAEVEAPWEAMTPQVDEDVWELMSLAQQSASALMQVAYSAGPNGRAKAREILNDTRRKLYQILADGDTSSPTPEDDAPVDDED
ncbi:MAG TPA: PadR family transcriptional regulator [Stackebrandtia sp.]|uniref:PadR family transcriptional regulator n=1 Tax=Stackebrandtia sp. TaxID=2023065 RepID=UPI002D58593E|nr:PadR family transcriptional regulator [Stackebrandtia sp.]HZE40195.1 PadR family transcriptional regulator [Stackebrandtia sp.]